MAPSFLWYDLETWGTDPRSTRIAQFAAIRTDEALQLVDAPATVWVQPALDLLPSPEAALVTGLDPLDLFQRGCCEADAFAQINALMAEPGSCSVGWNSLRFDDEFIRYGLYRNFFDPYEREWANGNSRWDLLDFARLLYALRPHGIRWPTREDGAPSFRLEHLAAANGVEHGHAHDALSDVEATIGLARLFRAAQPKLWDYHLGFRDKQKVLRLLQTGSGEALLHVSSKFPASRGCAGIVLPIVRHPTAGNQVIVLELHDDPSDLVGLDAEGIADRVFVASDDLPAGVSRIALKAVHANRCPALVELRHVSDAELQRLGLDRQRCQAHAAQLADVADLAPRVAAAFRREFTGSVDVDGALYDALPDRRDTALRQRLRRTPPAQLAALSDEFRDPRSAALLFRYRARNWPQTLGPDELAQWQRYLQGRLCDQLPSYRQRVQELQSQHAAEPAKLALLEQLQHWGCKLASAAAVPPMPGN